MCIQLCFSVAIPKPAWYSVTVTMLFSDFFYEVTYLQMMTHHFPLFNTTVVTPLQCFQGWWNLHDLRWFGDQVLPVAKLLDRPHRRSPMMWRFDAVGWDSSWTKGSWLPAVLVENSSYVIGVMTTTSLLIEATRVYLPSQPISYLNSTKKEPLYKCKRSSETIKSVFSSYETPS